MMRIFSGISLFFGDFSAYLALAASSPHDIQKVVEKGSSSAVMRDVTSDTKIWNKPLRIGPWPGRHGLL